MRRFGIKSNNFICKCLVLNFLQMPRILKTRTAALECGPVGRPQGGWVWQVMKVAKRGRVLWEKIIFIFIMGIGLDTIQS